MRDSRAIKSFFAIFALFAIVFLLVPEYIQAADNGEEELGFFERVGDIFRQPVETWKAVGQVVLNLGLIIGLMFTGVPLIFAILAGTAYAAMLIMSLAAAGIFAFLKYLTLETLSITVVPSPDAVKVVQDGWAFSRDLVSLLFIVILVFIGLATILRFQNYQAQKILPLLIIMALLVNFSGVVVGFVVDIGNLITFAFLDQLGVKEILVGPLEGAKDTLFKSIQEIPKNLTKDPITFFSQTFALPVLDAFALAIFYLVFILVVLVVVLLFIIRVGVLWLLTILAPFAFAAYILPVTRKFWSQWWEQLFQWAFIGVPMAFFLLLSTKIASIPLAIPSDESWFGSLLITIIQPAFVLLFLIVGFFISVTFVPKGAQFVTSGAERGFKAAGKTFGQRAWKATKTRTARMPVAREAQMGWIKARTRGQSWPKALRESMKRGWGARSRIPTTRAEAKATVKATAKETWAATKGTASAFGASLKAGWGAALKKKKREKGFECPRCKYKQSKDNDFCESCGFMF